MRSYVPNTPAERKEMLKAIGLESMDDLFSDIPEDLKLNRPLDLPAPMSEMEIRDLITGYVLQNDEGGLLFRGAGAYHHYIPAVVPQLASRSEFYTAYTPYQAEMSQGMLQSIFEWQTVICNITGMEASNASVYDGATAAAESLLMLANAKRKDRVLYSAALNPGVIMTMKTYAHCYGIELVEIPVNADGITDMDALAAALPESAGYIAAQPNYFGCIENMDSIAELVHANKALLVSYCNPISLGTIKRPADYGADIAIGDSQPMGIPMCFGGPYAGFMATTNKLIRNLPGRIVGETVDHEGGRAYVLTLQAREQHIRREKATSNICSNQSLMALYVTIYMSLMGAEGLRKVNELSSAGAHYLYDRLLQTGKFEKVFDKPFLKEFVLKPLVPVEKLQAALLDAGIFSALETEEGYVSFCVTEKRTKAEVDSLIEVIGRI